MKIIIMEERLLSLAARMTLIKPTLSNLPIYYLSVFKNTEVYCKNSRTYAEEFLGVKRRQRKCTDYQKDKVTRRFSNGGLAVGVRRRICLFLANGCGDFL